MSYPKCLIQSIKLKLEISPIRNVRKQFINGRSVRNSIFNPLAMKREIAIGADIGGSHITCQLFNLRNHQFIGHDRIRESVDSNSNAPEILDSWVNALREAAGDYRFNDLAGIGFAMPGPFDYQHGIAWFKEVEKFDHLYGINIRSEIQQQVYYYILTRFRNFPLFYFF